VGGWGAIKSRQGAHGPFEFCSNLKSIGARHRWRWVVGFGDAPVESPGHPTKEPGSTETGTHGNRKSPGRGGGGFASTGWEPGSARPAWAGGVLSSDMQLLNEGVRKINVQGMDCEAR
jgi:hypothetical protein